MSRFNKTTMMFTFDNRDKVLCEKVHDINTNNAWGFGGYVGARYQAIDGSISFDYNKQCGRHTNSNYYISNIEEG